MRVQGTLFTKLMLYFILVVLITAGMIGLVFTNLARGFYLNIAKENLIKKGYEAVNLTRSYLEGNIDESTFEKIIDVLDIYSDARLMVVDAKGNTCILSRPAGWTAISRVNNANEYSRRQFGARLMGRMLLPGRLRWSNRTNGMYGGFWNPRVGENGDEEAAESGQLQDDEVEGRQPQDNEGEGRKPQDDEGEGRKPQNSEVEGRQPQNNEAEGKQQQDENAISVEIGKIPDKLISDLQTGSVELASFQGMLPEFSEKVMLVGIPVNALENGDYLGAILLVAPVNVLQGTFNKMVAALAWVILAAIIISCVLGIYLSSSIAKPLHLMSKTAIAMADGDFSRRVDIKQNNEIGRLGDALNYMAGALGELEKMRRDYVANVSHELRTPLTSIQGFIEPLMDGAVEDRNTIMRYYSVIHQETLRLSRLVGDLLDLSRLQSEHAQLEMERINMGGLISEVAGRMKPLCMEKGVELICEIQPGLPDINANEDRVHQILTIFLDNALEHSESGSKIILKAVRATGVSGVTGGKGATGTFCLGTGSHERQEPREREPWGRFVWEGSQGSHGDVSLGSQGSQRSHGDVLFGNQSCDSHSNTEALRGEQWGREPQERFVWEPESQKRERKSCFAWLNMIFKTNKADMLPTTETEEIPEGRFRIRRVNGKNSNKTEIESMAGIIVTITDMGCGISEEDLPHIWERFYKADRSRGKSKGTGLGLSIARQLILMHNGKYWVESSPGKGSTFGFILPRSHGDV